MAEGGKYSLSCEPKEVDVKVPSTDPQDVTLTLTNNGKAKMAFKIKTTKNQRFKIRPAMGIIAEGGSTSVKVTVHPIEEKPEKPDSFGIHEAEAGDETNANSFWTCNSKCEVQQLFTKYG